MSATSIRLVRLLNMVPYLKANPGVSFTQAARDLGVSKEQLTADLEQLTYCGLPGSGGGDTIDIWYYGGLTINLRESQGMDHPLRLTSSEATTLLLALSALAEVPGLTDPAATRSALAKIEAAAGVAGGQGGDAGEETSAVAAVRAAVRDSRALAIEYYSASRDTLSGRVVDPIRLLLIDNRSYLEAWCRSSEGVRMFRFDRIQHARVLDEPSAPPEPTMTAEPDTGLFDADPSLPSATLRIAPASAWMLEYYPMRLLAEHPDGHLDAAITYASQDWLVRLLLGFGGTVSVLAPEGLAEAVRAAAADALTAYRSAR
ncbi:helix-turn-helix transcriptional regulator [Mycolicibacterium brumae]|uniref:WYL domain-containing protein n=1 Tax=Mycolicibacterium brumae TaxID=85968 RepID=A0A2G5PA44_9MYCO|nr:WYL domain-containing protein [Mycolicibacterium brumae]MCV7192948.1 WYL domain-containing protein [Mycolicibacterium brumae]PIB75215.1 WYL domain-containing protein [Mycolicibacterium brumae]RWA23537.1 hypothetical protein MBRU_01550 [Mycolicibacterium brumae DSM 44177]UWW08533.1 WYL domain-containing protein [Mycolicibacterium brumae]